MIPGTPSTAGLSERWRRKPGFILKYGFPEILRCSASYLLVQDDKSKNDMVSSMFWCGMDGDGHEFWECDFAPPESGLYWYRFELETCRGRMPLLKGEGGKGALSSGTFLAAYGV